MKKYSIKKILKKKKIIGKKIKVNGWIKNKRNSKKGISFLDIYDGSCIESLQVIANIKKLNNHYKILRLTTGCSVSIKGLIIKSIGSKQIIEMKAKQIKIIGWIKNPNSYPISKKKHTLKYLRKFCHLRPRTNIIGIITRIRHTVSQEIHKFMNKNNFFWISTPIITTIDTEGFGNMFKVSTPNNKSKIYSKHQKKYKKNFFKKDVFLTVSGQLNGESYACALSKIYTFGPVFRAEKSNTRKHLSEFWMVEPEIAFATLKDIIKFSKIMLKNIIKKILKKRNKELEFLNKINKNNTISKLEKFITSKFINLEYTEAVNILNNIKNTSIKPIKWGTNLSSEHEKFLTQKYFNSPIIIKNHPKNIKAFYMRINKDKKTVASMDILIPNIGEIIGGSQREERIKQLDKRIKELKLSKKTYWWYRDLRKYGTVPHSGFGLGIERLILFITGVKNIKETIPFPRNPKNAFF